MGRSDETSPPSCTLQGGSQNFVPTSTLAKTIQDEQTHGDDDRGSPYMRQEQRETAGQIRCRMHRALLPEVGDSVMVRINEIDDDVGL